VIKTFSSLKQLLQISEREF